MRDIERIRAEVQAREANRKDVASRFTGQFARGGFIAGDALGLFKDFKRRNGMVGGGIWTGKDYLPSLLADKEIVLNPSQASRIRALAGFDVFKHAYIPNYQQYAKKAVADNKPPSFASGVNFGNNATGSAQSEPKRSCNGGCIGDVVINLNGKRIKDVEIESIAVGGIIKYQKRKGRITS
jgi:hypothetical protein